MNHYWKVLKEKLVKLPCVLNIIENTFPYSKLAVYHVQYFNKILGDIYGITIYIDGRICSDKGFVSDEGFVPKDILHVVRNYKDTLAHFAVPTTLKALNNPPKETKSHYCHCVNAFMSRKQLAMGLREFDCKIHSFSINHGRESIMVIDPNDSDAWCIYVFSDRPMIYHCVPHDRKVIPYGVIQLMDRYVSTPLDEREG